MPVTSSNTVTLDGSYELVHFTEGKLAPTLPLKDTQLTAKLEGGKLSGNGGINDYTASYTSSKDLPPSQISISEVVSTSERRAPERDGSGTSLLRGAARRQRRLLRRWDDRADVG